eukprot:1227657-Amphidinium_carterae.1
MRENCIVMALFVTRLVTSSISVFAWACNISMLMEITAWHQTPCTQRQTKNVKSDHHRATL